MIARVATRLILPVALALAAACGGDKDEGSRPPLAPPPVSPNLTVHSQGDVGLNVLPGALQVLDPARMPLPPAVTISCEKLVFLFSWRVDGKRALQFSKADRLGEVKIGEGRDGVLSISGCAVVNIRSKRDSTVIGELKYVIAETR